MNNVKKLLAVLIVVTMLVTAMIPAMAADSFVYEDEAEVLADLGLMVGDGTDMDLDGELTREMGVVLLVRLLGAEEDALDMTDAEIAAALKDYSDKDEISFWAEAYVAYATEEGYLVGRDDGSLDPKANLLGKDYATMILRAMGYEVDAAMWAVAADELADVGGLSDDEAELFNDKALIRDDAAGITYAALLGEVEDGGTLIAALVAAGAVDEDLAIAAGLIPVVADVKDVVINNLKEVVITFTAPVNATEAAKVTNYSISNGDTTVSDPASVVVSADAKSVVLTKAGTQFTNYSSYTVVVEKLVGIPADATKTVVAKDVTIPTLVSATPTGPKTIKLTFSEPVITSDDLINLIKLDNGYYAIKGITAAAGVNSITVETWVDLTEGSHTITLSAIAGMDPITDCALYAVQPTTLTFNYVKDVSPITYTVGTTTEKTVAIKFNKAVKNVVGNATLYATHTYNTDTNKVWANADPAKFALSADGLTMTITFNNPLAPGSSTVYVGYSGTTITKIADGYGNVLEAFSFSVTTTPDLTKPTATVAFTSAEKLTVTFSEAVVAPAKEKFVLKDSAGTVVAINSVDTTSSSVYVLNTAIMNGGSYSLQISGVKDLSTAENVIDTVTLQFTATDKVAPEIVSVEKISDTKYRVNFSEAMDVGTITNLNAYRIYDYTEDWEEDAIKLSAFDSKATITASANSKSAIITFSAALDSHYHLFILAPTMKDIAGNSIDLAYADECLDLDLATISGTAEFTGSTTIKLTINDVVTGMSASDFVYTKGETTGTANSIAVAYDASKTYITLYIPSQGNDTVGTGITVSTTTSKVVNAYGTAVMLDGITVSDKYAPKMLSAIKSGDKAIDVTFSEDLYAGSVYDTDFTVAGFTVVGVTVADDVVTINVKEAVANDAQPVITIVGSVEDIARNAATSGTVTVTKTVVPET